MRSFANIGILSTMLFAPKREEEPTGGGGKHVNGTVAAPRPTTTGEAIDLTADIKAMKVPALTARLEGLERQIAAYDDLRAAADACNEEIAGRLHGAGVAKHTVNGEERRVRGVNGASPPRYRLYALTAKKPRTAATVDINNL